MSAFWSGFLAGVIAIILPSVIVAALASWRMSRFGDVSSADVLEPVAGERIPIPIDGTDPSSL